MEILFSNIIPAPIPKKDIEQSEIWGRDIILNSNDKFLIYADSGKGKTTFINIIFGTRKDYTGDLLINNTNIRDFSDLEISVLRKEKISIVPQGLQLFPDLDILENIQIKNRIQSYKTEKEISNLIEIFGLKGLEKRKAAKLSFGQRQRVAVIRSLCQSFEFILLDEAFSHLDETNSKIVFDLVCKEAESQNAGIILTSLSNKFEDGLIKYRV